MKSIIVILPYFGKLPNIFPFWLESCILNSSVDFLIATDQQINCKASNIKVIQSSLPNIKDKLERLLGMRVWLEKPYKLYDFRPLYKELFFEYVKDYDFWGYCDCDLIFGNIREFLTDELLNKKNYILGMGHFHIQSVENDKFENVWKTARGLWRNIQWKEVFQSSNNEWFDELPYGVSGRYYEMYPDLFWSGFGPERRCYDSPSSLYLFFKDGYNCYDLYSQDPAYQNHVDRLLFWKRKKSDEINNIVYIKDGISLYSVGINKKGEIIKTPILYVHFYKRKFTIKTTNMTSYMIYPNTFDDIKKISGISLRWYANNPLLYLKTKICSVFSRINVKLNGR